MTDAQFMFWVLIAFVALLFVLEQALVWVGRLARWLERWGL